MIYKIAIGDVVRVVTKGVGATSVGVVKGVANHTDLPGSAIAVNIGLETIGNLRAKDLEFVANGKYKWTKPEGWFGLVAIVIAFAISAWVGYDLRFDYHVPWGYVAVNFVGNMVLYTAFTNSLVVRRRKIKVR